MDPETARRQELERGLRLVWRGIDPAKVIEELSRRLTNKLTHTPTCALVRAFGEAQFDSGLHREPTTSSAVTTRSAE